MNATERLILQIAAVTGSRREELLVGIVNQIAAKNVMELGVWKGEFSAHMLKECPGIAHYYMLDPWRHLDHWNKPANVNQQTFDDIRSEAMATTDFARDRRIVLHGTTAEMIDRIPDEALDLAYIDGDHTLRGITIDLIRTYRKIRPGGIIAGDDYTQSIWQHADNFEPTLICPFAAYFAESQDAPLIVLPYNQFTIIKPLEHGSHHRVIDTTNSYGERNLLSQIERRISKNH